MQKKQSVTDGPTDGPTDRVTYRSRARDKKHVPTDKQFGAPGRLPLSISKGNSEIDLFLSTE